MDNGGIRKDEVVLRSYEVRRKYFQLHPISPTDRRNTSTFLIPPSYFTCPFGQLTKYSFSVARVNAV